MTKNDKSLQNKRLYGLIAQLVEQWTENPCVTGSIPVQATKPRKIGHLVDLCKNKFIKCYFFY